MNQVEIICREKTAPLHWADASTAVIRALTVDGLTFDWGGYEGIRTSMTGLHQIGNAVTAVRTAQVLRTRGWSIGEREIRAGLFNAKCVGRLEVLSRAPMVLVDGAHNPQGARALMESLRALFPGKKITLSWGCWRIRTTARWCPRRYLLPNGS
jgi:dihydrofolate synthase/folylpolyglutamate synthase